MDSTKAFLGELEASERKAMEANDDVVPSGQRRCPICRFRMRWNEFTT